MSAHVFSCSSGECCPLVLNSKLATSNMSHVRKGLCEHVCIQPPGLYLMLHITQDTIMIMATHVPAALWQNVSTHISPCRQLMQVQGWQQCLQRQSCGSGSRRCHESDRHTGQGRWWHHPVGHMCTNNVRTPCTCVLQRSHASLIAAPPVLCSCSGRRSWDHPGPTLQGTH
jgi:hypothetical protein